MEQRLPNEFNQVTTLLCLVLALVFSTVSLGNAIDGIQHSSSDSPAHAHALFSNIALIDHQDDQPDSLFGHHHHHGDNGSAMPTFGTVNVGFALEAQSHFGGMSQTQVGIKVVQMERPPKHLTTV